MSQTCTDTGTSTAEYRFFWLNQHWRSCVLCLL